MNAVSAEAETPLQRFTALLGNDVFFVPCKWGTKKPLVTYAKQPFEGTKTPAYRAVFDATETNIAVYLGKASGGLCAIDLDSDEDLSVFLDLNPALAVTTRSRGSRGGMVWLRIKGYYPDSCSPRHRHFEWRADNRLSTIHGRHPKGMDYTLVVDATPVAVPFSSIVWPKGWELPWVNKVAEDAEAKLRQTFCEPFYRNDTGMIKTINEGYWAGMHAAENTILHEPDEKTFYRYNSDTGITRTPMYGLVRDGKVRSIVLRQRGKVRGTRPISYDSLMAYLRELEAEQTKQADQALVLERRKEQP